MMEFWEKSEKPSFWAIFGPNMPNEIFFQKSGFVSFLVLLYPILMQNFRKNEWTVNELSLWRTDGQRWFRITPRCAGATMEQSQNNFLKANEIASAVLEASTDHEIERDHQRGQEETRVQNQQSAHDPVVATECNFASYRWRGRSNRTHTRPSRA